MDRTIIAKLILACGLASILLAAALETVAVQERAEKKNMSAENTAIEKATFAGGCFWCSEADFEKLPGVVEVISGYTDGRTENPTYAEVCSGESGHVEAVEVRYDPGKVTYEQLLDAFWRHIDPTDAGGQFVDRGRQYRSAIFYHDAEQKRLAEESKAALEKSGRFKEPVVTEISEAVVFYEAETYHQDYYKKSSVHYKTYRRGSGRDRFIQSVWGDEKDGGKSDGNASYEVPDDSTLRATLTPLQYKVARKNGTEPPFSNEYWDNKKDGIYVDVVSGEPLFSSLDKFKSGTGWPSFTKPLEPDRVMEKEDRSLFMKRVEVRSRDADSHLGHLFPDGPAPTGLRYCVNSAALRFVPVEDFEKEGYGKYAGMFNER